MACLGQRKSIFTVRFRYGGRPYQKSLKTRNHDDAVAALHGVEQTLHLLRIGRLVVPPGVDAGDFVVSGGAIQRATIRAKPPSFSHAIAEYLAAMQHVLADTYRDSQRTHLGHFQKFLKGRARLTLDRLNREDVDGYLGSRLNQVDSSTVEKERITLRRFFSWAVDSRYIETSPAAAIARLPHGRDLPPFRTVEEIEELINRGGLGDEEAAARLWERVYLNPQQIAQLLRTVEQNAAELGSYQLHSIAAYTGMRRGEVLRLRWSDANLADRVLIANSRKQSRRQKETSRRIDIHPELHALFVQWRSQAVTGQYVIGDPKTSGPLDKDKANRWFWQPLRGTSWCLDSKKNWFKVTFHSYRHSFASNMAAAGIDQRIIDEILGHTTDAMRRRYRHLFPRDRRAAIEAFSLAAAGRSEGVSA